jgi:hypothetical protein
VNRDTYRKSDHYHFPGAAMFTGLCGAVNTPDDLTSGLTSDKTRVTCAACRALMPGEFMPKNGQVITFRPRRETP